MNLIMGDVWWNQDALREREVAVSFQWVKGHAGVVGNEIDWESQSTGYYQEK